MSRKMSDRLRRLRPASTQRSSSKQRSNSKQMMLKLLRWGWIAGTTSVISLVVSILPALAEELSAWNYDTETRSLNITLPVTTTPTLSVVADDQLLVELPNTQVGKAIGQTVFDGVVESIVLEQATPEIVWMVVDFAPGTVLARTQSATSIVSSSVSESGMRQWQVRPELMATRRVSDAIAALPSEASTGAAALRNEPTTSAQNTPADFPDLPILEPAIPIDGPVIVPPITARAPEPIQPAPLPPAIRQPPKPAPVSVPAIVEAEAVENEPVVAILEPEIPAVPSIEAAPIVKAPLVADPSVEVEMPEAPVFETPLEAVATEETVVVEVVGTPALSPPVALNAAPAIAEANNEPPVVISEIDLSDNRSSQTTNSRWPEPIPFGQPLP